MSRAVSKFSMQSKSKKRLGGADKNRLFFKNCSNINLKMNSEDKGDFNSITWEEYGDPHYILLGPLMARFRRLPRR